MARTRIPPATLAKDARNRAWRTLLQTAAATAVLAVAQAVIGWAAGGRFDWRLTAGAAITAAAAPILALLQRLVLDPSSLPSATPPTDPLVAAKARQDAQRLGVTSPTRGQSGHAGIGTVAGALLLIVVILLIVKAAAWLTGSLAVVVIVLLVLALVL